MTSDIFQNDVETGETLGNLKINDSTESRKTMKRQRKQKTGSMDAF